MFIHKSNAMRRLVLFLAISSTCSVSAQNADKTKAPVKPGSQVQAINKGKASPKPAQAQVASKSKALPKSAATQTVNKGKAPTKAISLTQTVNKNKVPANISPVQMVNKNQAPAKFIWPTKSQPTTTASVQKPIQSQIPPAAVPQNNSLSEKVRLQQIAFSQPITEIRNQAPIQRQIRLADLTIPDIEKRLHFENKFAVLILGDPRYPLFGPVVTNLVRSYAGRLNIYFLPADGKQATILSSFYSQPLPKLRVGLYSSDAQVLISPANASVPISWVQLVTKLKPGSPVIEEATPDNEGRLTSVSFPQLIVYYDGTAQGEARKIRDNQLFILANSATNYMGMVQYIAINIGNEFGKMRFTKLVRDAKFNTPVSSNGELIIQGFQPSGGTGKPSNCWEPLQLSGGNIKGQVENYIQRNFAIPPAPPTIASAKAGIKPATKADEQEETIQSATK